MDPSREPSADMRNSAKTQFELFNALCLEGFTEAQALQLLGAMLAAVVTQRREEGKP